MRNRNVYLLDWIIDKNLEFLSKIAQNWLKMLESFLMSIGIWVVAKLQKYLKDGMLHWGLLILGLIISRKFSIPVNGNSLFPGTGIPEILTTWIPEILTTVTGNSRNYSINIRKHPILGENAILRRITMIFNLDIVFFNNKVWFQGKGKIF